jgi:hypothetical protein
MYVHEKKANPDNKNPLLLDYWLKGVVNEKITRDPSPRKTYTKINSFGGSKVVSNKTKPN